MFMLLIVAIQSAKSQNTENSKPNRALVEETYGAVGKEARMLLKEVSELLEERKQKDYLESAYTQISAHFQEGTRSCGRRA